MQPSRSDGRALQVGPEEPVRAQIWAGRLARVITFPFVRFDVAGGACANEIGPCVIAGNHRSMFDVAVGLIAWRRFGRYPRLLVAREYVQGRASGRLARALGVIPVDRGLGRGNAVEAAVASLRAGRSVLVMPEGRLHVDPVDRTTTGRAHTGVARIAWAARAPVMAAAVVGSDEVWPKEARYPRPRLGRRRLVTVRIADQPLWLQGHDARADTEQVMAAIRELLRSAEQEWCRFDVDRR